nr:unnamed protein product [Digitaria exilis]
MEVDDSNGALVNKSEDEKKGSSDPVVYQLVRVEGDGTLVPATEDDVLEFEHFLQDEKGMWKKFSATAMIVFC